MARLVFSKKNYIHRATFKDLWGFILLKHYRTRLHLKLRTYLMSEVIKLGKRLALLKNFSSIINFYQRMCQRTRSDSIFYTNQKKVLLIEIINFFFVLKQIIYFYFHNPFYLYKINILPAEVSQLLTKYSSKGNIFGVLNSKHQLNIQTHIPVIIRTTYIISSYRVKWILLLKWLYKRSRLIRAQQEIKAKELAFHSLFKFRLYRKYIKPQYLSPNNLNFKFVLTRQIMTEKMRFFKLYQFFLFWGWDISKYQLKLNLLYNYLKRNVLKLHLPVFTILEYSLINILFRANFVQYIYQAKLWIEKGFFLSNRINLRKPECTLEPWALIAPCYEFRVILYKNICNRISALTDYSISKKKTVFFITHKDRKHRFSLFHQRWWKNKFFFNEDDNRSPINNRKSIFNRKSVFFFLRMRYAAKQNMYNLLQFSYSNIYKYPILLNYPGYMEVTYKCLIICPFRTLKAKDFTKRFPSFLLQVKPRVSNIKLLL